MGLPTSKKKVGLGKSLMRSRFTPNSQQNPDGSIRHTAEVDDSTANWTRMQSITQENDLEAFLNSAQLAGTDFTAERLNVTVVSSSDNDPYILSADQERETLQQHKEHRHLLTVPRRPYWDSKTTPEELKRRENDSFLEWRRGLVELEEEKGLIMTPYERNLEVWRQLWRVIERSDLVVQIVDSRNPILFRSTDLEAYVKEVDERKKNLLLVNKADMLTVEQRIQWADWFDKQGIRYVFFSAALAKEELEAELEAKRAEEERLAEEAERKAAQSDDEESSDEEEEGEKTEHPAPEPTYVKAKDSQADVPERARTVDADELVALLMAECPDPLSRPAGATGPAKKMIGFVGYPNVGKSSTLNALVGTKRVTVSSTPGKTKHFQTIHLSDEVVLCDCPGLVFPSFATTKADLVVNGILPIDQLREFTGPAALVGRRVPKWVLENVYTIKVRTRNGEGIHEDRQPTGTELLQSYAIARGYTKSSQGNPDEARAARYILKDYVSGRILYAHPPPGIDSDAFNAPMYQDKRFAKRKPETAAEQEAAAEQESVSEAADGTQIPKSNQVSKESSAIDSAFFAPKKTTVHAGAMGKHPVGDFARVKLYPHQGATPSVMDTSSKERKAHDKKNKRRGKQRTEWTALD